MDQPDLTPLLSGTANAKATRRSRAKNPDRVQQNRERERQKLRERPEQLAELRRKYQWRRRKRGDFYMAIAPLLVSLSAEDQVLFETKSAALAVARARRNDLVRAFAQTLPADQRSFVLAYIGDVDLTTLAAE